MTQCGCTPRDLHTTTFIVLNGEPLMEKNKSRMQLLASVEL